uniref:Uncharacterized protein n=1 Tax=Knipowitschia caucasica TaxID=637954 RepID=A0AAV2KBN7_KNICA
MESWRSREGHRENWDDKIFVQKSGPYKLTGECGDLTANVTLRKAFCPRLSSAEAKPNGCQICCKRHNCGERDRGGIDCGITLTTPRPRTMSSMNGERGDPIAALHNGIAVTDTWPLDLEWGGKNLPAARASDCSSVWPRCRPRHRDGSCMMAGRLAWDTLEGIRRLIGFLAGGVGCSSEDVADRYPHTVNVKQQKSSYSSTQSDQPSRSSHSKPWRQHKLIGSLIQHQTDYCKIFKWSARKMAPSSINATLSTYTQASVKANGYTNPRA